MSFIVKDVADFYTDLMENKSDPRVKDWPLMSGPLPTLLIILTYAFIVKVGPKVMENRKPFKLRRTLIVYNFYQVIMSSWLFYELIVFGWFTTASFRCEPVDYSNSPKALRTVSLCWWYLFAKFTELFDTFFFILRKKNDQLTWLHVIHHGCMPVCIWFGVKFVPGGHGTFFGMLNSFVHIVMYSYYMLAALGPHVQKYLWWKKYLTTLQMAQFVLDFIHSFQLLFIDCDFPKVFTWWIILQSVFFYFMFHNFYKHSYIRRDQKIKVEERSKNGDVFMEGHSKMTTMLKSCRPASVIKRATQPNTFGQESYRTIKILRHKQAFLKAVLPSYTTTEMFSALPGKKLE